MRSESMNLGAPPRSRSRIRIYGMVPSDSRVTALRMPTTPPRSSRSSRTSAQSTLKNLPSPSRGQQEALHVCHGRRQHSYNKRCQRALRQYQDITISRNPSQHYRNRQHQSLVVQYHKHRPACATTTQVVLFLENATANRTLACTAEQ